MLYITKSLHNKLDKHAKFVYLKNNLNSILKNKNRQILSEISNQPLNTNSLLFLNNGLSQSKIIKLRSLFLSYNLSFKNIPLRSLNTCNTSIVPKNRSKYFSGQLFILYSKNSFPLPFLHHFLLYFIAGRNSKNSNKSYQKNLRNLGFSKQFHDILNNRFTTELSNEILPWDSISMSPLNPQKSQSIVNEWLKEDPFSIFFNSISNSSLIYSGSLSSNKDKVSITLNNNNNLPSYSNFSPSITQYKVYEQNLILSCFFSIEPYNLSYSGYNSNFLFHL